MIYDYIIVGSGLFGCVWANLAIKNNQKILFLEKRNHPFGNCYTENLDSIEIHKYGPHIFHTSNKDIWNYVNQFAEFNNFINRPKVNYQNKIYSFPINLLTLYQLWGVQNPKDAKNKLDSVKISITNPENLEEYILSQVGEEIYYTFIYGYTKKQWGTDPKNLPSSIIKRLPIRLSFDDNYFNDVYQGIPIGGYSKMLQNMIEDSYINLDTDYINNRDYWNSKCKKVIYCGEIDKFYNYKYGKLEYRSLRFEINKYNIDDYQGSAIINYTDADIEYTRTIEHKHFSNQDSKTTIVSTEYPTPYTEFQEPYYPINTDINNHIYNKYKILSNQDNKIIFGGRLAQYKYLDMHQVIGSAIKKYTEINNDT